MAKVLFIDSLSPIGHVNFNNIHVEALCKAGFDVECAFREGYSQLLKLPDSVMAHEFRIKGMRDARFDSLKFLMAVRHNMDLSAYDHIIHSSYADVPLLLSGFPKSLIIDHNNLSKLKSRIRAILFKLLSRKHVHISLSKEIQEYLNGKGIENILIQHGLPLPFRSATTRGPENNNRYKIFIPSASSSNPTVLREYFSDNSFLAFLSENNVEVVLRSATIQSNSSNIKVIKDRLSDSDYASLFVEADLIWLPYPRSFENRVSGVLMEAIANQKDVLLPDIKTFGQYRDIFDSSSYYNSVEGIISSISSKIRKSTPVVLTDTLKSMLTPDYRKLNSIKN